MAHIRIEMDRGRGWEIRQEGDLDITREVLLAQLPNYACTRPHRMFFDGEMIGEMTPRKAARYFDKAAGRRKDGSDVAA